MRINFNNVFLALKHAWENPPWEKPRIIKFNYAPKNDLNSSYLLKASRNEHGELTFYKKAFKDELWERLDGEDLLVIISIGENFKTLR